jgi:hypothetical protein
MNITRHERNGSVEFIAYCETPAKAALVKAQLPKVAGSKVTTVGLDPEHLFVAVDLEREDEAIATFESKGFELIGVRVVDND